MTLVMTRATKQAARYTDAGGRERCSACRFFMPQGTCGRIVGPVSPRGWCKYYSQEAVQRWQPQGMPNATAGGASLDISFISGSGTLDPRITFTRASTATYFDAIGTMQTAGYNQVRNSTMAGAVTGTPGTMPTNWTIGTITGVTTTVVGTGVEAGIPYIDISFVGTPTATGGLVVTFDSATGIAAVNGQTWTLSFYQSVVGGSTTNTIIQSVLSMRGAAGVNLGDLVYTNTIPTPGPMQRFVLTQTLANASTQFVVPKAPIVNVTNGQPVNLTLRIGGPQMELASAAGSFAPTNGAANGAPRFDYDPVTHALRGLLIEEARTNLVLSSTSFSGWTQQNVTWTPGQSGSPDGTATRLRLIEAATTSTHYISNTYTTTASTIYTVSVFAQAQQDRYLQLSIDDSVSTGAYATFDVQAGTITGPLTQRGAAVLGTAAIQSVGNGIYRCSISSSISTATTLRLAILLSNVAAPAFAPSYAGNTANGMLLWGMQIELGAFPTSYIPTTTVAVTRAQDNLSQPTDTWFNTSAGTFSADCRFQVVPAPPLQSEVIGVGTNGNNLIRTAMGAGAATMFVQGFTAAVNRGIAITANSTTAGAVSKHAFTYNGTGVGMAVVLNGGAVASVVASAFPGFSIVYYGGCSGRGGFLSGHMVRVRYWPRVLSNAEMQQVTT